MSGPRSQNPLQEALTSIVGCIYCIDKRYEYKFLYHINLVEEETEAQIEAHVETQIVAHIESVASLALPLEPGAPRGAVMA